ncbi:MAG: hypothetical protein IPK79_02800 [Vampirovibrionales bacterium]|nr:hypothetical protein [Vampirovibrionales bacterium]
MTHSRESRLAAPDVELILSGVAGDERIARDATFPGHPRPARVNVKTLSALKRFQHPERFAKAQFYNRVYQAPQ